MRSSHVSRRGDGPLGSSPRLLWGPRRALLLGCLLALALAPALGGCSWQTTKSFFTGGARLEIDRSRHWLRSMSVEASDARLSEREDGRLEMQLVLTSQRDETLAVRLLIDPPGGDGCEHVYLLEPHSEREVECVHTADRGRAYWVEITSYEDVGETEIDDRELLTLRFDEAGAGRFEDVSD